MIEIENSELGAVTKIELFKYLAEIVANGSFAKEHPGGYFFVAHALCYKGSKLPLLVGEPELGIIKALAARNKLRQPVHHRFAKDPLSVHNRLKCRLYAVEVLFEDIPLCAEIERFSYVFVIGVGGELTYF